MSDTSKNPPMPTPEMLTQSILDMSVESWRFCKLFNRLLMKLDAGEQARYQGQFRWFRKKIDESLNVVQFRVVDVEGHSFDAGMAATPINIDEFDSKDKLVVDQMLEPIVVGSDGNIIKAGTVVLRKVQP